MKKIIGIIILSFLMCNFSYAFNQNNFIKQHLSDRKLDQIEGIWSVTISAQGQSATYILAFYKSGNIYKTYNVSDNKNSRMTWSGSGNIFRGSGISEYGSKKCPNTLSVNISGSFGNGSFNDCSNVTMQLSLNRSWPSNIETHNAKFKTKEDVQSEEQQMLIMVNDAKKTCGILGFQAGTEKFTDCTLKLYSQKVDELVAEKQARSQVVQNQSSSNQSSGSNVTTIYDPVRDSQNLMNKGQKMLSGGCTLGVNC